MDHACFLARCPDCSVMLKIRDIFEDYECPKCSCIVNINVNGSLNDLKLDSLRIG